MPIRRKIRTLKHRARRFEMSWLRVRLWPSTSMPVLSTSRCSRPFDLRYMRSTLAVFVGLTERIQTVRAGSLRSGLFGIQQTEEYPLERGRPETPQRYRPATAPMPRPNGSPLHRNYRSTALPQRLIVALPVGGLVVHV